MLLFKEEIMTEEEKALAGYLYDAQEESLGKERLRSQELSTITTSSGRPRRRSARRSYAGR